MPPTRRRPPRRTRVLVSGLSLIRLQLGPVTAADRAGWLALRDELPRESWPAFAAFWSLHPGIPDDLRPALGREAWGAEAARVSAGRQAWLEAHRWPRAAEPGR